MSEQLFVLGKDIWNSIDFETVKSSFLALQELDLAHLPFDVFDIKVIITDRCMSTFMKKPLHAPSPEDDLECCDVMRFFADYSQGHAAYKFLYKMDDGNFYDTEQLRKMCKIASIPDEAASDSIEHLTKCSLLYLNTLIVLLSTKNAEKVTEQVKRHGPKSKKRPREYKYITTIKVGKITETMHGDGEGRGPVRPHLRRGHIRNQRIGEGRKETKQVFIQPVFVNADEKWIENQRQEYRIKI